MPADALVTWAARAALDMALSTAPTPTPQKTNKTKQTNKKNHYLLARNIPSTQWDELILQDMCGDAIKNIRHRSFKNIYLCQSTYYTVYTFESYVLFQSNFIWIHLTICIIYMIKLASKKQTFIQILCRVVVKN